MYMHIACEHNNQKAPWKAISVENRKFLLSTDRIRLGIRRKLPRINSDKKKRVKICLRPGRFRDQFNHRLEQENGQRVERKVEEATWGMGHERSEALPHHAVPRRPVRRVKLLQTSRNSERKDDGQIGETIRMFRTSPLKRWKSPPAFIIKKRQKVSFFSLKITSFLF